ncbi:extracellular solute-binding protein [Actibacterium sp.]|uniref:extracellular solute-binding protein n=1 Tax=Actibacterium sp. TaxID=1872125 RepID=UPI00356B16A5
MALMFLSARLRIVCAAMVILWPGIAPAEPAHGIAMYGAPALPADFTALPYVNPDAPKGGRIVLGESGGFDSLNPFITKGRAPFGVQQFVFETLMGRNWDEPFSLYGLLAESIDTPPDRSWVEFTLRPEARFSDGAPVTVEDVLWSYETLGSIGHPRYHGVWNKVARAEATGPRSVRFTFNTPDRELPLLLGMRPILQKAQWQGRDFDASGTDIVPIGSAPYVIDRFEAGRYVVLKRNPDYWGNDLPLRRGQMNFDEIRYDYFGDGDIVFEAFRGGEIDSFREPNAAKWATAYDFPAVHSGEVIRAEIPHQRPSGIAGFVMNTRRPVFADWRVRQAMIEAFNFEFINQTLNDGAAPRITSYFSNSALAMRPGPAGGKVLELLTPFADDLLPGALEGYALPVSDGKPSNRSALRRATDLLEQAGWHVGDDGVLKSAEGQPFSFDILLKQGATETQQIVDIYVQALKRLGIFPRITSIDSAQYTERTTAYDFDMTYYSRALSLSPGNEQYLYWGPEGVTEPGSRNWMGADNPAIPAMIDALLNAGSNDDFLAATRALDRVLTTGRYVIPIWYSPNSRLAYKKQLHYPKTIPIYGDWLGFQPDIWWFAED